MCYPVSSPLRLILRTPREGVELAIRMLILCFYSGAAPVLCLTIGNAARLGIAVAHHPKEPPRLIISPLLNEVLEAQPQRGVAG